MRRVLVAEHLRGELLGDVGLAHAGRSDEEERADRPAGILEIRAGTPQGARDGAGRDILADDLTL